MRMYNTKNIFRLLVILFLGVFAACSETEEIKEPSKVDVTPLTLESNEIEEQVIKFYAAADWTASLSNSSWIQIDPMTKVGSEGEAIVKFSCRANEGTKERSANMTIKVENEEPYIIRIMQVPSGPYIIIEKEAINFEIDPALSNKRGAFVAEITVLSNTKWDLKELPEWVSYLAENDKESIEGINTTVKLQFQADPAKFTAMSMVENLIIESVTNPEIQAVMPMTVKSEVLTKDFTGQEASTFMMERSAAAGNNFMVAITVEANTNWTIKTDNLPEWLQIPIVDNEKEYTSSLITKKTINLFLKEELIDTDKFETEITFVNALLGFEKNVKVIFPGTGLDYYECTLRIPNEFEFSASRWDENWVPIPGAILDMEFSMLSGTDYTNLYDTPFKFIFIKGQNGFTMKEEIYWAGIEYIGKSEQVTYGPLHKHDFALFLQDNYGERREGYLIITDTAVTFEDLFIEGTEDLKPEYDESKTHFVQQGAPSGDFDCEIQDNYVAFTKEGDTQLFEIYSSPEMVSADFGFSEWLSINFVRADGKFYLEVKAKPNMTGEIRFQEVNIMQYVPEDDSEKSIYSFFVEQAGE